MRISWTMRRGRASWGVARSVAPRLYNAASASHELKALMGMPDYRLRAARVGRLLAEVDGAARGAAIVLIG
jgi:hypothetical protein